MLDGVLNEIAPGEATGELRQLGALDREVTHETAAPPPDLDSAGEWPDEPERDLADAHDPENWPMAGDPSDVLNDEAERASNTAAVLRAAADSIEGRAPPPKPERWVWQTDDAVLAVLEQPLTGVWENSYGAVVVMQERDREEQFIFLRPENVPAVIRKMAELIGMTVSLSPMASPSRASPPAPRRKRGASCLLDGS
jgi:hypothetical protein